MQWPRIVGAGAAIVALTCFTSAALAVGARTVTFTDPKDGPAALSGPAEPDVQSAGVSYDPATGTIVVSVDFYAPVESRPAGDDTLGLDFGVSEAVDSILGCDGNTGAAINLFITPDYEASILPSYATLGVYGKTGTLQVNVDHAAGSTSYSATFVNAALAGQSWRCASVGDLIGIPACPFYPDCDSASTVDTLDRSAYFDGLAPGDKFRAYWRVTAHLLGGNSVDVVVRNTKVKSLSYRLCLGVRTGRAPCKQSRLSGTDELVFPLNSGILRPLHVTIFAAGSTVAKTVPIR